MSNFLIDGKLFDALGIEEKILDASGKPIPSPHGGLGKWGRDDVPKRDWDIAGDGFHFTQHPTIWLDSPLRLDAQGTAAICDMCETARIAWVFRLTHPDYAAPLYVGSECAKHMVRHPTRLVELLKDAKAARKLLSADWRLTAKGAYVMHTRGFQIVLWGWPGNYWASVRHKRSGYERKSKRTFRTVDDAKAKAVNVMFRLRREKPWPRQGLPMADYEPVTDAEGIAELLADDGFPDDTTMREEMYAGMCEEKDKP